MCSVGSRRSKNLIICLVLISSLSFVFLSQGAIASNPEEISDWHGLNDMRNDLSGDYVLVNDLDENTDGYEEHVDTDKGWEPIGNSDNRFEGTFDGDGYEIKDLTIDRLDVDYIGLFGYLDSSTIQNVGMVNVDIFGKRRVGGLSGRTSEDCTVSNTYSTGVVKGKDFDHDGDKTTTTGGLVGVNSGDISNSYSASSVDGHIEVGGLVGRNNGEVTDSFSTGEVSGDDEVGGLVGRNNGEVTDSYWNSETSGTDTSDGGEPRTTEQMIYPYEDTYEDWDFVNTWQDGDHEVVEDHKGYSGYPALWWQAKELEINIEGDGSTNPEEGTHIFERDEEVDLEAEADDDWHFDEWSGVVENIEDTDSASTTVTMEYSYSITAVFEENYELDISISGNGSVGIDPGQDKYEPGTEVDLEAEADDGWFFEGWTGDVPEDVEENEEITVTMDSDKEITANFNNTTTLDVSIEGDGSVEKDPDKERYDLEEEVTLTAEPDDDWVFDKWEGDYPDGKSEEDKITIVMDSHKEVTANFMEAKDHTLQIDIEGGGETDPEEGTHYYDDYEEVNVTASPHEGWFFSHWTGNVTEGVEEDEITLNMTSDRNITAHFNETSVNVTTESSTVTNDTATLEGKIKLMGMESDDITVFFEWREDGENEWEETENETLNEPGKFSREITDLNESTTYEFRAIGDVDDETDEGDILNFTTYTRYNLTINIGDGSGETDPEEGTHTYIEQSEVTVEATASSGWMFDEWEGDYPDGESEENEITILINESKNITAHFEEDTTGNGPSPGPGPSDPDEYTLEVEYVNEHGEILVYKNGDLIDPDETDENDEFIAEYKVEEGTDLELDISSNIGYVFDEWSGDRTGDNIPLTVTMSSDKSISAVFVEVPTYTLTMNEPTGEGTVIPDTGSNIFEEGDTINLEAFPEEGWEFDEWTGDVISEEAVKEIEINENMTVAAVFKPLDEKEMDARKRVLRAEEMIEEGEPGYETLQRALEEFENENYEDAMELASQALMENRDEGPGFGIVPYIAISLFVLGLVTFLTYHFRTELKRNLPLPWLSEEEKTGDRITIDKIVNNPDDFLLREVKLTVQSRPLDKRENGWKYYKLIDGTNEITGISKEGFVGEGEIQGLVRKSGGKAYIQF